MNNYPFRYICGLVIGTPIALYMCLVLLILLIDIFSYGVSEGLGWIFIVYALISPVALPICVGAYYLLRSGIRMRESITEKRVNYFARGVYWAVIAATALFGTLFVILVGINLFG